MAKNEPGRDPEMVSRTRALNVVFALTSLGLLVVLSLMVWADYDRPWKKYQKEFTTLEQKRTEEQIQQALGKVDAARKAQIEAQLQKGEQEAAQNADAIRKAQAEVDDLHNEWYRVDQDFRFTKAKIDWPLSVTRLMLVNACVTQTMPSRGRSVATNMSDARRRI